MRIWKEVEPPLPLPHFLIADELKHFSHWAGNDPPGTPLWKKILYGLTGKKYIFKVDED